MGAARSHHIVYSPLVGKELHAFHGLLHRPCSHVCQVPYGGFHSRDSGVYHSSLGYVGAEAYRGGT